MNSITRKAQSLQALARLLPSFHRLFGEVGISAELLALDLEHHSCDYAVNVDAAVCRQALALLAGFPGWPVPLAALAAALTRCEGVMAGDWRLRKDDIGWLAEPVAAYSRPLLQALIPGI